MIKRICYVTQKKIIIHPVANWVGSEDEGDRLIEELNRYNLNAQYVTEYPLNMDLEVIVAARKGRQA